MGPRKEEGKRLSESQRCGDGRHKDTIWAARLEGELFTLEWRGRGSNNNNKSEQGAAWAAVTSRGDTHFGSEFGGEWMIGTWKINQWKNRQLLTQNKKISKYENEILGHYSSV